MFFILKGNLNQLNKLSLFKVRIGFVPQRMFIYT
jgi:hypothetical protein